MDFGCTGEMTELTIHMGYAQLKCLHVKLMLKARLATTEKLQQMLTERTHRPPSVTQSAPCIGLPKRDTERTTQIVFRQHLFIFLINAPRCADELASMDLECIGEMAELTIHMGDASMHKFANRITPTLVWTMSRLP